MTPAEVSQIVVMLIVAYTQGDKMGDERVALYERALGDLDYQVAKMAVMRLIQTSRFLPTVAEVREAARVVAVGVRRTGSDAWGDVVAAIRHVGSYGTPVFEDPITQHVVKCLGWMELCLGDNEASLRARFTDAYEARAEHEANEQAVSAPYRLADVLVSGVRLPRALIAARQEISDEAQRLSAPMKIDRLLNPPDPITEEEAREAMQRLGIRAQEPSAPKETKSEPARPYREPETPELIEQRRLESLARLREEFPEESELERTGT